MTGKRKYELKKRADEMAQTRLRITEAAVELHGTIGPAFTTLSAVAERAGVQRHTVYRHFPTDAELFAACAGHYLEANPWPDPDPWRTISDPHQRLATALDALYAYYERTEQMFSKVFRDAELVEAIPPVLAPMQTFLGDVAELLTAGLGRPRPQTARPRGRDRPCDRLPHLALPHSERNDHESRSCRALRRARRRRRRSATPRSRLTTAIRMPHRRRRPRRAARTRASRARCARRGPGAASCWRA